MSEHTLQERPMGARRAYEVEVFGSTSGTMVEHGSAPNATES